MIELSIALVLVMAFLFLLLLIGVVLILLYTAVEWWRMDDSQKRFEILMLTDDVMRPPAFALSRWLLRHALRLSFRSS